MAYLPNVKVYGHIHHTSAQRTHQFGLRSIALLIVEATENAESGFRLILLHKFYGITQMGLEVGLAPGLHKITTVVGKFLRFHHPHIGQDIVLLVFHLFLLFVGLNFQFSVFHVEYHPTLSFGIIEQHIAEGIF